MEVQSGKRGEVKRMTEYYFEIAFPEKQILEEIADKRFYRLDVSMTYRLCMQHSERESIDWLKINTAIIKRWSKSALTYIKEYAHSGKCFSENQ